jgi:hypothetical protein
VEGQNAANLSFTGSSFANQNVPLQPATDAARAQMIRSSIWNGSGSNFTLRNVPNGIYQIYLYVWEDNEATDFDVRVQDKLVQANVRSGNAGEWKRLGPWNATVADNTLKVLCSAADANLSGVELWKLKVRPELTRTTKRLIRIGRGVLLYDFTVSGGRSRCWRR